MKAEEMALVVAIGVAGIVAGFIVWTYVGPMIASTTGAPAA